MNLNTLNKSIILKLPQMNHVIQLCNLKGLTNTIIPFKEPNLSYVVRETRFRCQVFATHMHAAKNGSAYAISSYLI